MEASSSASPKSVSLILRLERFVVAVAAFCPRTLLQVNNSGSGGRLWVPASPTAITAPTHAQPVVSEGKGSRRRFDARHMRWPYQQAPSSRMSSDSVSTTGSVDAIMGQ